MTKLNELYSIINPKKNKTSLSLEVSISDGVTTMTKSTDKDTANETFLSFECNDS